MHLIDLMHDRRPQRIGCWVVDDVLVDPGPESTIEELTARLGDLVPNAVLLTHIHFDHAGAIGALVQRWPHLRVFVHMRGARHLSDPRRLLASATRVWGEERMEQLWGSMQPVPVRNLRPLQGGEKVLGHFHVVYTPGHASHHVSYLRDGCGTAFVGDVAGVRVPPATTVLAPAPPPDIDIDLWTHSLARLREWDPTALALTHFGLVEDVSEHLEAMRLALREEAERAHALDERGFVAWINRWLDADGGEALADHLLGIAPAELTWRGLRHGGGPIAASDY
jgi:glyoxylase-like metal-dependent hydrolase (beta-lactamase superfamily II)